MLIFMVKMSFATWSSFDEEEYRSEVTLMDREVGSNWLDKVRPETDFRFRNFTKNVPQSSTSMVMSSSELDVSTTFLYSTRDISFQRDQLFKSTIN